MAFQLVLFAAIAIAIVIACCFDYIRHGKILANQASDEFKNLREFLQSIFGRRLLEYHVNKMTESDKTISKIRALQVKLRNSNHSDEVYIAIAENGWSP